MTDAFQPVDLLKVLGHEARWRMVEYLAQSDRRVQEIVDYIGEAQNQVSYHLKQLRSMQLVSEHRSSADGRDIYYHLDLERLRTLFLTTGQALHPAIIPATPRAVLRFRQTPRVLFLCTHNSARSQMAEGCLRHFGHEHIDAFSAGISPTALHPYAVAAMADLGIDIRQQWSKPLDQLLYLHFDVIVTVCDRAREQCPPFPDVPFKLHWSLPDPVELVGEQAPNPITFRQLAEELVQRVNNLLSLLTVWFAESPALGS